MTPQARRRGRSSVAMARPRRVLEGSRAGKPATAPNRLAVMFSRQSDKRRTPPGFFQELHREFTFAVDVAASPTSTLCREWVGPSHTSRRRRNALAIDWRELGGVVWMNPPFSGCQLFMTKAALERRRGVTTVALVPARTETAWWHEHVWDDVRRRPRPGVEIRFVKGRISFLNSIGNHFRDKKGRKTTAPFPAVVVIFKGAKHVSARTPVRARGRGDRRGAAAAAA